MRPHPFDSVSLESNPEKIIFILVVTNEGGLKGNDHLKTFPNERKVMEFILTLSQDKDPRKIKNIKSIDVQGATKEYEVVFDGRLRLEVIPEEIQMDVPKILGGTLQSTPAYRLD